MTGPWKHAMSGLSRDEPGHDGLQNSSSGANGIKMQTAHGAVGKGPFVGGTTVGIQAESGWAHQVTPHLLLCLVLGITTTDLELGSPGCPLLVISGDDRNAAAPNLQPQKSQKRTSSRGGPEAAAHLAGPPSGGTGSVPISLSGFLHLCLAAEGGAQDNEGLWCSLQRHREEFVPRLAADLLGVRTQQRLGVFKLTHDFLKPGEDHHVKGNQGPQGHCKQSQPTEILQRLGLLGGG